MVEFQLNPMKHETHQYDAFTLCAAVNIANFIYPCTNQRTNPDKKIPNHAFKAWSLLGLSPELIESVITVARLQIIEVLNIIR